MTADQLQQADAADRAAFRRWEEARAAKRAAISQALAEGWTQQQVADALGITRSRVSQITGPRTVRHAG